MYVQLTSCVYWVHVPPSAMYSFVIDKSTLWYNFFVLFQLSPVSYRIYCRVLEISVRIIQMRCFSGPRFPVLELNSEIYGVNLRIQSKYEKIRTRKNSVFQHLSRSANLNISTKWVKASIQVIIYHIQYENRYQIFTLKLELSG